MPIKSYKMDLGTLTLGDTGSTTAATAQVTKAMVTWSEDVGDDTPTLSGEVLPGEATYTASLKGTVIQDLTAGGLTEWTWTNKGKVLSFTFLPNAAAKRQVTGKIRVSPLDVGGDVNSRPSADFEWGCVGEPVLGTGL